MTCRDCQDQMLEVARRRAAPFVEEAVRAHADTCEPCRAALEQAQSVSTALRSLAVADAAHGASQQMEARLLAAFADARPAVKTVPDGRSVRWMPVAAGVVLCAGIAAWSLTRPAVNPGTVSTPSLVTASPPGPAAVIASRETATAVPSAPEHRAPTKSHKRPARAAVTPTGFVPIPAAAGLPDFESGEIVRVGIPITSLPNYGVEIPPDATAAAIQADFLVGQDGQPRAIRLVTTTVEDPRPRR